MDRIFFHLDVNSAFLSWSAAYLVNVLGERTDLRQIPSVVGGAEEDRHGIVLAGSIPAKRCGIRTGQTLYEAMKRCPDLVVIPSDYALYEKAFGLQGSIFRLGGIVLYKGYAVFSCLLASFCFVCGSVGRWISPTKLKTISTF